MEILGDLGIHGSKWGLRSPRHSKIPKKSPPFGRHFLFFVLCFGFCIFFFQNVFKTSKFSDPQNSKSEDFLKIVFAEYSSTHKKLKNDKILLNKHAYKTFKNTIKVRNFPKNIISTLPPLHTHTHKVSSPTQNNTPAKLFPPQFDCARTRRRKSRSTAAQLVIFYDKTCNAIVDSLPSVEIGRMERDSCRTHASKGKKYRVIVFKRRCGDTPKYSSNAFLIKSSINRVLRAAAAASLSRSVHC